MNILNGISSTPHRPATVERFVRNVMMSCLDIQMLPGSLPILGAVDTAGGVQYAYQHYSITAGGSDASDELAELIGSIFSDDTHYGAIAYRRAFHHLECAEGWTIVVVSRQRQVWGFTGPYVRSDHQLPWRIQPMQHQELRRETGHVRALNALLDRKLPTISLGPEREYWRERQLVAFN